MAVADNYKDRATLVDAVYDHMLTRAGATFPVGISFFAKELADAIGISYSEGKPGYGPSFEKVFGQEWDQLVKNCASWLAAEDYFLEWQSSDRMFANTYRLSERGAILMGCLPSCLSRAAVEAQPGDENL